MRFGMTKTAKEKFYAAEKTTNTWDVNVDNTVISKLVKAKTSSKYLIGYLGKAIKPLVLMIPKMSGMLKHLKLKTKTNSKLLSFCIDDEKLLEQYKAIWTKIKDLNKY